VFESRLNFAATNSWQCSLERSAASSVPCSR